MRFMLLQTLLWLLGKNGPEQGKGWKSDVVGRSHSSAAPDQRRWWWHKRAGGKGGEKGHMEDSLEFE